MQNAPSAAAKNPEKLLEELAQKRRNEPAQVYIRKFIAETAGQLEEWDRKRKTLMQDKDKESLKEIGQDLQKELDEYIRKRCEELHEYSRKNDDNFYELALYFIGHPFSDNTEPDRQKRRY